MSKKINPFNFFLSSLLLLLFIITYTVEGINKFPNPTQYKYVNDYVGILNNNELQQIVSIGKELEDKTTAQAIVVIIDSTNGEPIESYANNLFRRWGIGDKNKDNGLLLLVSMNDKKWRIEVGRGLEGAIPDALSNTIMTSLAQPNFASGNYGTGIVESYSTISDYIANEYNTTLEKSLKVQLPNNNYTNQTNKRSKYGGIVGGTFLVLFILDILLNRGRLSSSILNIIFLSNLFRGPRNYRGGSGGGFGGFGGFGGGSSNGGGSSGDW